MLDDVYQDLLIDHSRHSPYKKIIQAPSHTIEAFNPLCGDKLNIMCLIENNILKELAFNGEGCLISQSSGSIMCGKLQNLTKEDALSYIKNIINILNGDDNSTDDEICALCEIKKFPMRVKCATLAWHGIKKILEG